MKIIAQLNALRIPNIFRVKDVVQGGLMVTVAGIKTPWAFIRLWDGPTPAWAMRASYIEAKGTKGAPYRRHILKLFKSQRDAWMIGGDGPLEVVAWGDSERTLTADRVKSNQVNFLEYNSEEALVAHGYGNEVFETPALLTR